MAGVLLLGMEVSGKLLSAVDKLQQYGAAAEATVGRFLHIMES